MKSKNIPHRYYESYRLLSYNLDVSKLFRLTYNEDKETYSFSYLYKSYKNELEPVSMSIKIVSSVKKYLEDNLFSIEEKKLLLNVLIPDINFFSESKVSSLKRIITRINLYSNKEDYLEYIEELNKSIRSLEQINDILNNEIISYFSALTSRLSNEDEKINQTHIMGNIIINNTGNGNVINTGNESNIENHVTIYKSDLSRLQSELEKHGVDKEDIQKISEIISTEQPNIETNRLGKKSNDWISKIINKSLNGIGKISTGITANILATLIKQYYGMP